MYLFRPEDFVQTTSRWVPFIYPELLWDIMLSNIDDTIPGTGDAGITPESKSIIYKITADFDPVKIKFTDAAYKALPVFCDLNPDIADQVRKALRFKELPLEGLVTLKVLCEGPFKKGRPIHD